MNLRDLSVDLFGEGIPTVIEGGYNFEKQKILKPAFKMDGLTNQVVFLDEFGDIEKVVVGGCRDHKCYCEEIIFKQNEEIQKSACCGKGELPPDHPRPSADELDEFRRYVAKFNWKTAKTFENFSPHQYILNFPCWKMKEDGKCGGNCESCKAQRTEFEKWAMWIRKYGERQKMLKTVYTVFCCDERQYWTMGDPMNTTWVLNRALIDDPNRKPKLYWLDRN